ncbi:MAG: hypothetical protein IKT93_00985 [Clostridia bacterium]|nr:hypothetical protein [Clostridia bacterium]
MTKEALLSMQIGETIFDAQIGHIHRVVGGWIYQFNSGGVFVPYSEPKPESDELTLETTEPKRRGRKPIITK